MRVIPYRQENWMELLDIKPGEVFRYSNNADLFICCCITADSSRREVNLRTGELRTHYHPTQLVQRIDGAFVENHP